MDNETTGGAEQALAKIVEAVQKGAAESARAAVAEAMQSMKHEQEHAADNQAADDPLVTERIERMVDEQVAKGLETAEERFRRDYERAVAETSRVEPGAYKHAVDLLDHTKAVLSKRANLSEIEVQACNLHDAMYIIRSRAKDPDGATKAFLLQNGVDEASAQKALDTYTSTTGSQWVNQVFSNQFVSRVALGGKVLPLFPRFPMTDKVVTVPRGYGRATAYRQSGAENTSITADTTALTGNVTFTAEDINLYQAYSDNLDADAVVSVLPLLTAEFSSAISEWLDIVVLDGCDSADLDTDWSATTDPRYCWDGLRKKAATDTGANADLSTFSSDNLFAIPSNMAGYNADPAKLNWIVPSKTYWGKLMNLRDAQNNSVWLPCNGPTGMNPIVTGQIGWLGGIPVTASGLMKTDLNASGVHDGSTTTKGSLICVYRDAWWFGDREQISLETQRQVAKRNTDVVMVVRADFQHMQGTDNTTAMGYNF